MDLLPGQQPRWRGFLIPSLALVFFLALFFWTPLTQSSSRTWTTADLLQDYLLTNVTPGHRPGNRQLSDPVVQMVPWALFNRESLARLELPLWNPYNATGQPLLANWQSGVFSVFNLPIYLLGLKCGLLVRGILVLSLLAFFTWLFLREIGISACAATAGACIFTFCGHNILLLNYPHAGGAVALPAGMFFAERAIRAAVERRTAHRSYAGLTLTTGLALLAGHPEPVLFAGAFVFGYAAWRVFRERRRIEVKKALVALLASGLIAVCISLVQVLPFLEYFPRTSLARVRVAGYDPLPLANWPIWFFPNLLGNPSTGCELGPTIPPPNYEAANTIYIGAIALFSVLLAIPFARSNSWIRFFLFIGSLWFAYLHGIPLVSNVLEWIPGVSLAPMNRSQIIGTFCAAALTAYSLDALRSHQGRRRVWTSAAILIAGGVLFAAARFSADRLLSATLATVAVGDRPPEFDAFLGSHFRTITTSFLAALLGLALIPLAPRPWIRTAGAVAVVGMIFVQTGWALRGYNACSADEHVFPSTPLTQELREEIGNSTLLVLGQNTLVPESNILFKIRQVSSYDALGLWPLDQLVMLGLETRQNWRPVASARLHLLQLFGVQYVLSLGDWPAVETLVPGASTRGKQPPIAIDLDSGREVSQEFVYDRNGLNAVMVQLGVKSNEPGAVLQIAVEEAESGKVLVSRRIDSRQFSEGFDTQRRTEFSMEIQFAVPTRPLVLEFAARPDSAQRRYRIRMSSVGGEPGQGFCAWRMDEPAGSNPGAMLDGAALAGSLLFDASAAFGVELRKVANLGALRLWRLARSPGRAWIVHEVRTSPDPLGKVIFGDLPPFQGIIMEDQNRRTIEVGTPSEKDGVVTLEDAPRRMVYDVNTLNGGYLALALPWYPGWRATIDGTRAALDRANHAFQALKLPPGPHRVVIEYDPMSVKVGGWFTILGSLAAIAWLVFGLHMPSAQRS